MKTTGLFLFNSFNFLLINCNIFPQIVFSPSELIRNDKISNSSIKQALRYGFHKTSECNDFVKAYICVQKCVDLNYDIAYSDKNCFCTCYMKTGKGKYTPHSMFTKTKWKLGAPSTTKPAWAESHKDLQDVLSLNDPSTKKIHEDDLKSYGEIGNETGGNNTKIINVVNDTKNTIISSNVATAYEDSNMSTVRHSHNTDSGKPVKDDLSTISASIVSSDGVLSTGSDESPPETQSVSHTPSVMDSTATLTAFGA